MDWRLIIGTGKIYLITINILEPVFLLKCQGYILPLIGFLDLNYVIGEFVNILIFQYYTCTHCLPCICERAKFV